MKFEPTIMDNVSIPEKQNRIGRPRSEKWMFVYDLEVGQSAHFDIDQFDDVEEFKRFRRSLSSMVSTYSKRVNRRFTVRTTESGVGVWRTA